MSPPVIRAEGLRKSYGAGAAACEVLRGVALTIHAGELTLLMGPSGSGKTTLISILAGLSRPSAGSVELCGIKLAGLGDERVSRLRREKLGFVFQGYNLFPALTALGNVALVYGMKGLGRQEAELRAREALSRVGLGGRERLLPEQLSSGQKQRVAVARALALAPPLIIGDEVTGALDAGSALGVMELLRASVTPSGGVLLVTHDRRLERFADRVIEMEDGRLFSDRRLDRGRSSEREEARA